jgi:hypothetical protein
LGSADLERLSKVSPTLETDTNNYNMEPLMACQEILEFMNKIHQDPLARTDSHSSEWRHNTLISPYRYPSPLFLMLFFTAVYVLPPTLLGLPFHPAPPAPCSPTPPPSISLPVAIPIVAYLYLNMRWRMFVAQWHRRNHNQTHPHPNSIGLLHLGEGSI